MSRHIAHRLLISIPVLFGVLLIGFCLLQVVPTDPATILAGPTGSKLKPIKAHGIYDAGLYKGLSLEMK